jgi:hypothetical protein
MAQEKEERHKKPEAAGRTSKGDHLTAFVIALTVLTEN